MDGGSCVSRVRAGARLHARVLAGLVPGADARDMRLAARALPARRRPAGPLRVLGVLRVAHGTYKPFLPCLRSSSQLFAQPEMAGGARRDRLSQSMLRLRSLRPRGAASSLSPLPKGHDKSPSIHAVSTTANKPIPDSGGDDKQSGL